MSVLQISKRSFSF